MKIIIYQNREVYKEESKIGNDSENKVETLEFEFPEEYRDFTKYIEFQIKGEKYVDLIEDNKYVITREVAKYGKIKTQVVLKKNTENDVMIFKSDVFTLTVSNSINATENLIYTVGVDLIEKIVTKNNEQDTRLNNLELDNTTNKENISNLQNDNTTNKTNIKSLQDDNEVNKTDISNIKQEQTTQNTNIEELQTDNTSNKAKILDLEAKNTEQDEEIEQIKAKDTTQDSLIEQLQAENTSLKNQIPSGEATGNPIHLTDSSNMECEIAVVGNSEQETRSGSNILNFNVAQDSRVTVNDDGTLTINGAGGFKLNIEEITLKVGITYYNRWELVSGEVLGTANPFLNVTGSGQYITKDDFLEVTLSEEGTKNYIWVNANVTLENVVVKIWANTDKSDFEPYGASLSPDYPSEIVTVGQNGSVEIEVCNKNFINMEYKKTSWSGASVETEKNKIKFVGNQDGQLGLSYSTEKNSLNLKAGTKISYSSQYIQGELTAGNTYYNLELYYTDGTKELINMSRSTSSFKNDMLVEKVLPKDVEEFLISGSGYKIKGLITDLIYEFQLEVGNATNIIEHESYTKVLPIQKEFVKIGNVEDTFVKVDGKWYEAHYHPKIVFDGTENFEIATSSVTNISAFLLSNKITDNSTTNLRAYCNRFTVYANENWHQMPNNSIILGRDTRHQVLIRYDDITTVDDFKAKLANWYEAGQPLTGYYILATPELIECTEEQSTILNSFYTYKNVTNISVDGIGTLKVNYKKDLDTIINKLSATSVAE